ncbi:MAG: hypothetical protein mread185_000166 [Mycoplasmataceae bacterium]|nr:MAG: hypothetical protein mread185_000166 [Mycoplasmataceae bacterium]
MARIQEFNNQEFLKEISNRVRKHEISEDFIKKLLLKEKKNIKKN